MVDYHVCRRKQNKRAVAWELKSLTSCKIPHTCPATTHSSSNCDHEYEYSSIWHSTTLLTLNFLCDPHVGARPDANEAALDSVIRFEWGHDDPRRDETVFHLD